MECGFRDIIVAKTSLYGSAVDVQFSNQRESLRIQLRSLEESVCLHVVKTYKPNHL